jgi:ectoine hydroxylase-related dioxygenase (phytanoyl-CoA dioxygenase family)
MSIQKATREDVRDVLEADGVAIVAGVLDPTECRHLQDGMWACLEHISSSWATPIRRDDRRTYREFFNLFPTHGMLLQHWVGHAQASWDVRQNPKVVDVFRAIYQCTQLLVSFDGMSFGMKPEDTGRGWEHATWLHTDQSFTKPDFACIQSWLTALDVDAGDATLAVLRGSHKYHAEFAQAFGVTDKSNWYKLQPEQQAWYLAKGCELVHVECKAGDMVLWDSRTIHSGKCPSKGRLNPKLRMVVYVSMQPRAVATERDLKRKREAFDAGRTTSHWAATPKLFGKVPRTYGKPLPEITPLPTPALSELGRALAGF